LKEGKQPNAWTDGGRGVFHLPPDAPIPFASTRCTEAADKRSGQQTARGVGNERCNWKSNTAQGNMRRGSQDSKTSWLGALGFLSTSSSCWRETWNSGKVYPKLTLVHSFSCAAADIGRSSTAQMGAIWGWSPGVPQTPHPGPCWSPSLPCTPFHPSTATCCCFAEATLPGYCMMHRQVPKPQQTNPSVWSCS